MGTGCFDLVLNEELMKEARERQTSDDVMIDQATNDNEYDINSTPILNATQYDANYGQRTPGGATGNYSVWEQQQNQFTPNPYNQQAGFGAMSPHYINTPQYNLQTPSYQLPQTPLYGASAYYQTPIANSPAYSPTNDARRPQSINSAAYSPSNAISPGTRNSPAYTPYQGSSAYVSNSGGSHYTPDSHIHSSPQYSPASNTYGSRIGAPYGASSSPRYTGGASSYDQNVAANSPMYNPTSPTYNPNNQAYKPVDNDEEEDNDN